MFCFSPAFVGLLIELSIDKVCQNCICLNFLLSGKFAAQLWVPSCTVLVCGGAGSDLSELLLVGNFRELSAGTADGPLDMIFSVREIDCGSKGYMSRTVVPYQLGMLRRLKKYILLTFLLY